MEDDLHVSPSPFSSMGEGTFLSSKGVHGDPLSPVISWQPPGRTPRRPASQLHETRTPFSAVYAFQKF